jgi:hypothetical protein
MPLRTPVPELWCNALEDEAAVYSRTPRTPQLPSSAAELCDTWTTSLHAEPALVAIYLRLIKLVPKVTVDVQRPLEEQEALPFPLSLTVILRDLLALHQYQPEWDAMDEAAVANEAWRLGLLTFVAKILRFYGWNPATTHTFVTKQVKLLKAHESATRCAEPLQRLHVWLLCVAAMEAVEMRMGEEELWTITALAELTGPELDPITVARTILWIPGLHECVAEHIRNSVRAIQRADTLKTLENE